MEDPRIRRAGSTVRGPQSSSAATWITPATGSVTMAPTSPASSTSMTTASNTTNGLSRIVRAQNHGLQHMVLELLIRHEEDVTTTTR